MSREYIYSIRCVRCGKMTPSKSKARRYCDKCKREVDNLQRKESYHRRKEGTRPENGPSRPFTPDTPYLCQKWAKEGMASRDIAAVLNRRESEVLAALLIPLPRWRLREMEEYLSPWTPREIQCGGMAKWKSAPGGS